MVSRRRLLHLLGAGLPLCAGCLGTAENTSTPADGSTPTATRTPTATPTDTRAETNTPRAHPAARWTREFDARVESPPLFHDGTLYVGAGRDLLALDPADGSVRWRFRAPNPVGSHAMSGTALRVAGGHLLAVSGRFDGLHGQANAVHAMGPETGTERWRYAPGDGYTAFGLLPAADGAVFVGANDDALGYEGDATRAVSLADGSERWRTETGDVADGEPAEGTLYVGAASTLYALATDDGATRWRHDIEASGLEVTTGPGVVYLLAGHGETAGVALAADGSERWRPGEWFVTTMRGLPGGDVLYGGEYIVRYAPDGSVQWRYDGGGYVADAPVQNGTLFASRQGAVFALGLGDGRGGWRTETGLDFVTPETAGAGAVVSLGGDPRMALVHDAETGTERWRAPVHEQTPEPVVGDGAAFFLDPDGRLVARDL